MHIPGTASRTLVPRGGRLSREGTLRYLKAGTGAPVVLLHTVRTQAEHFRSLIPLISDHCTVYALDLPGMGHSEIVPGASYQEPAMRAGVERLLTELDLHDVTLVGESMGAVLALTTAAELPERVRRVIAVNAYDYRDGIARSGTLARMVIGGALIPGVGQVVARMENHAVLSRILQGGLIDRTALRPDYVDELLRSGSRPGYPAVARAVYRNMPSLIAARSRYPDVKAPVREAAEHTVDLWSTGIVFRAGHRIRVQVTSSNFPRWDRNLNTGEPEESATVARVARQQVFHDSTRPSRIVLPVVPAR